MRSTTLTRKLQGLNNQLKPSFLCSPLSEPPNKRNFFQSTSDFYGYYTTLAFVKKSAIANILLQSPVPLIPSIRCRIRKWLRVRSTKLSLVESGESDTNVIRDVAVHVFADLARSSTRMKMDRVLLEPVRHGLDDDSDWAPQSIASGPMAWAHRCCRGSRLEMELIGGMSYFIWSS